MSSNYGYGYDANYAAYAGYAAAQYNIMQQQQQQQPASNNVQVGYGHARSTTDTSGYGGQYQSIPKPPSTNPPTQPSSAVNQSQYTYPGNQNQPSYRPSYSFNMPSNQATPTTVTPTSVSYKPSGYTQSHSTYQPQSGYQSQTYTQAISYPHTSSYQQQYGTYGNNSKNTSYNVGGGVTYPNTSTNTSSTTNSMTPQQQQVVQQFVQQKVRHGNSAIKNFMKKTPKYQSQEEFYCEVCKVACGSPFAYKSHMAGKHHKKRVQQVERSKQSADASTNPFKCDICDIYCSNKDAFQAHVKGAKHLKTVNLFRKLGKPIPSMTTSVSAGDGNITVTAPRITFVGGKKLSSTGLTINADNQGGPAVYPPGAPKPNVKESTTSLEVEEGSAISNEVQPVGEHLIKSVKGDPRNPHATFMCELCECFFCDEMAKVIHCKGRRHRLNYKKQYQPDLVVEPPKAQLRQLEKKRKHRAELKKSLTGPSAGPVAKGRGRGNTGRRNIGGYTNHEQYSMEYEGQWGWEDPYQPPHNPMDDELLGMKHDQIRPNVSEMEIMHSLVQSVERVLKQISDDLLVQKSKMLASARGEVISDADAVKDEANRQMKGVMRVGLYARSLLLKGQLEADLVIMCNDKPTEDLLEDVYEKIPVKFAELYPDQVFNVAMVTKKAGMVVTSSPNSQPITINLTFTSTAMRDDLTSESIAADAQVGVLDRTTCLASLAQLRHTKWFQAMCQGLPSFGIVMRLFLDLGRRHPLWRILDSWMLELLVQKCIATANSAYLRPGDVFRRVIECIASGLFLPGGPGLKDPCEKGDADAATGLNAQERANLTLIAQHYLRLIAFNQLHLVLDVTPPTDYAPYSLGKHFVNDDGEEPAEEEEEGDEDDVSPVKKLKEEPN